jgi:uncharacterized integral membrane protein (TIGR00697 family)
LSATEFKTETRYLELVAGLFTGFLIISNVCSNRLVVLGPLEFDAGTLMFPLTYIFGDVLTEVYGFARSRRVIWTGFLALFLATLCLRLASLFPEPEGFGGAGVWDQALALTPRLAFASLTAYLIGEFANSAILAKMKVRNRQHTARRFIFSTAVGQSLDTCIFASIAFLGVLDNRLWLTLVISNYIYKVGFEIILLPVTLTVTRKIKKAEGLDVIDKNPSLNPFRWRLEQPVEN